MSDLIAAVATARGSAAIGILRLSGPGAVGAVEQVFRPASGRPITSYPSRTLVYGSLHDAQGRVIDWCLATVSRAPHSYTGEDTAELQCHGGAALLAAGLEALFAAGARQAGPGEFTKRAFLNGRLDLSQAEAVIDLIEADTAELAANAAGQLGGAIRSRAETVHSQLIDILAHFHAVLDYPDEEIAPFELASYVQTLADARAQLQQLHDTFRRGRIARSGLATVLLGRPNVGKSSLLNALAGYDRAIVTAVPGTTRDTVEERVRVGGVLLRLIDTAGLRQTADEVEALGVARTEAAAQSAELALCILDLSRPRTAEDARALALAQAAPHRLIVGNKCDLPRLQEPPEGAICLSARTGEGLDALEAAIAALVGDTGSAPWDGAVLTNARQAGAVARAIEALGRAEQAMQSGMTPDAVLTDVEDAIEALGQLTGRSLREDVVSRIFSRFCVGK